MEQLFSWLSKEVTLFLVSMVPLVELRGSIPLGAALGLDWVSVFGLSIIGNLLPVPFIILFGQKIFEWLKKSRFFSKYAIAYENRLMKKAEGVMKYSAMGLCLFVAVPLPGTGAWSGAVIAILLNMRMKYALPSIALGVVIAGAIMTAGSYGILTAVTGLF